MASATLERYASVHPHAPNTKDERPTAEQVIADCGLKGAWKDRVVLVTGATSGIGLESAKALASTGATLILTARDSSKADLLLKHFVGEIRERVTVLPMDLNSLKSIQLAADEVKKQTKTLNVLLCNAGIMACPMSKTEDGLESQFGVNFLAHMWPFNQSLSTDKAKRYEAKVGDVAFIAEATVSISPLRVPSFLSISQNLLCFCKSHLNLCDSVHGWSR